MSVNKMSMIHVARPQTHSQQSWHDMHLGHGSHIFLYIIWKGKQKIITIPLLICGEKNIYKDVMKVKFIAVNFN